MKRVVILVGCLWLIQGVVFADEKVGTTGATFLKIGVGAREVGMGETGVTTSTDAASVYWNPACLSNLDTAQLFAMGNVGYKGGLEGVNHGFLSIAYPFGEGDAVALSVIGLQVRDIPKRVEDTPKPIGYFEAMDYAGILSLCKSFTPNLFVGVNLKVIQQEIDGKKLENVAYGGDIGVLYKGERLSIGFCAQNPFGSNLRFEEGEDELPKNYKVGASFQLKGITLVVDVNKPLDREEVNYHGGGEVVLDEVLSFRAGYRSGPQDIGSGYTFGMGINLGGIKLDYAYLPYEELGDAHRLSLVLKL